MSAPALSVRGAREQAAFRALLEAMARPGTVGRAEPHPEGGPFGAALGLLEALLDHEVSFAVVPDADAAREPLLRYTGSRAFPPERADYLLCHGAEGIAAGLRAAKEGELEYPDRSGTVVALVSAVSARPGRALGESGGRPHPPRAWTALPLLPEGEGERPLTLAGPGVRTTVDVWVDGFTAEHRRLFAQRNAAVPNGVDVVLVAPDGRFTCLPRYARIQATGDEGVS
jgi:phosphonate C-P lyase system protein PhnH